MKARGMRTFGVVTLLALGAGVLGVRPFGAVAAPIIGAGSFSLPNADDAQVVYTSAAVDTAGVTVSVTSGEADVQRQDGLDWISLGPVPSGAACVFEGAFPSIRVKALASGTAGSFVARGPTDSGLGTDHAVGTATIALGALPARIYARGSAVARGVFLSSGSGDVSLRASAGGADLLTVHAGGASAYHGLSGEYWLSGSGSVAFTVLDNAAPGTWTLLPAAHWSDPFSPLHLHASGTLAEGDPLGPDGCDAPVLTYSCTDPDSGETVERSAVVNEAVIDFKPSTSASQIEAFLEARGLRVLAAWYEPDGLSPAENISWFHVEALPSCQWLNDTPALVASLRGASEVEWADFNKLVSPEGVSDGNPNDTYFQQGDQGYLADLRALQAWAVDSGSRHPIGVAVIDSGVDVDHPDLANKIYKHPTGNYRMAGRAGKSCRSFGDIDADTSLKTIPLRFEHGTNVAGVIGAETDNGQVGVAGCAPGVAIMSISLRVFVDGGKKKYDDGSISCAIKMLRKYLNAANGYGNLAVVNMSFSNGDENGWGKKIRRDLYGKKDKPGTNRVYVAAAGSSPSGHSGKEAKVYPAAIPEVLGVTGAIKGLTAEYKYSTSHYYNGGGKSTDPHLEVYGASAYYLVGATTDIQGSDGAGSDRALDSNGDYASFSGTSAATAQVSGLAGLIMSRDPSLSFTAAQDAIKNHTKAGPLRLDSQDTSGKTIPGIVSFIDALNSVLAK